MVVSFLLTLTILLLGCTEQVVSPPSTFSQTFKQLLPDTNIQLFRAGENSGDCWKVDGNHFVLGNCVQFLLDANIVGSEGQIPFLNADGNALEVGNIDFNKSINKLNINGSTAGIMVDDNGSYDFAKGTFLVPVVNGFHSYNNDNVGSFNIISVNESNATETSSGTIGGLGFINFIKGDGTENYLGYSQVYGVFGFNSINNMSYTSGSTGGDFQSNVSNNSYVDRSIGVKGTSVAFTGGTIDIAIGVNSEIGNTNGTINTAYGVKIEDVIGGTTNYSLYAGDGLAYFEDNVFTEKYFNGKGVIPYGVSSSANNTTTKQVTIPNFTAQAGDIFAVKFTNGSIITSSWDLFVSGVNLGKVYVNGSTVTGNYLMVSTGGVILFYYDGARVNAIGTTYTNFFDKLSLNRSNARPVETIYGWKIAMEDGAGRFRPIIKTTGSTGNNDHPNTAGFKLNGYMVLNDSANNYGTTSSMGTDFTSNGLAGTSYNLNSSLTNYLPLYWKGEVKSDGLFYFDQTSYTSWYTQTLPTTEDGFVYIHVGWVTSAYAFFIVPNHPAYEFKNGSIRLYEQNHHVDNFKEYFGTDNDSSITFDETNLVLDPDTNRTDSGLVYVDGNVSATGFITRTSVYDKSKGSALDKIKDADSLVNVDKSIIHENFFGYTPIQVTDYSRPVIITKNVENCFFDEKDKEFCEIEKVSTTTYPYTKIEGGVDLGMEIDVLRQAVFELKTELCKKDSSYKWCKTK